MSTSSVMQETRQRPSRRTALRDRRGLALAIVLGAQLMIILDMTVVNIALPSIARGLHFSPEGLSWVLNAYTLTFGGLLLLGGRAGDILGRRRVFGAGIMLFTAASLAGGLAQSAGWLLAARAAQGVGGAIASPAVLAMVTASFADGRERARALGIYTAVVMGGGSLGLVLGGIITEWVSWRWVLFINVPIGVLVAIAAPMFLPETARQPGHFDTTGALTSTAGMVSLVYGIIRAAADGWANPVTLATFAAAAVLLAGFVWHESRARQPITPLRLFADRRRAGSYLARLLIVAGMFGMFFFLTQFVQEVLGFSPLRAGISFLPMTAALFGVSRLAPRLVSRFRPWHTHGDRDAAGGSRHDLAVPYRTGNRLPGRGPRPDGAHRRRDGRGVRTAHHGLAVRGTAGGLGRRVQHGERDAAGRRLAGAGRAGHRGQRRDRARGRAGRRGARDVPRLHPGGRPGCARPPCGADPDAVRTE